MRIKYKISILLTLLIVVIILLLSFAYIRIAIWAADKFVARSIRHQMTNVLVDEDEIDWDKMQEQIDRVLDGADELLYAAVYDTSTGEAKLASADMDEIQTLIGDRRSPESPQKLMEELSRGDVDIKDAREVEIFIQSDPGPTSLRIVIGYLFPISEWMRYFITPIALVLIFISTAMAIVGSFILAGGITKPIRKLAAAMQDASEGNMDTAVRVRSKDEVGQLARVFNKMMYQLKEKTSELEQLNRTLEERVERGVAELRSRNEAERRRLLEEIQRAREVQMGLFPQSPPRIEGFDIWGVCHPANEVGGDFFDYLSLDSDRLCIALGDVSGKGMKGAMNAVMAHGMLHAQTRAYSSAAVTISELNEVLTARFEETTFTTLSLGIIDTRSKEIQLCNAGNPYPILFREGEASSLELSGMPLGIISEIEYDETKLALMPGDVLVFYSDGISEAMTSDERMYGMDALRELVGSFPAGLDSQAVVERILQDVRSFVGDFPQSDDMTVIVVRAYELS